MSDPDEYRDLADELEDDGFIVDDEPQAAPAPAPADPTPENTAAHPLAAPDTHSRDSPYQQLIRAHINVIVSALGGVDQETSLGKGAPPAYAYGHDALACLKDLKRWLRSADEKNGTYDVALACALAGVVANDLVVMLCQWDWQLSKKLPLKHPRLAEKIMLACLELLVLLTWPAVPKANALDQQKLQFDALNRAQLEYKLVMLHFNRGRTLKAVIRLALPAVSKPRWERDARENATIKLVVLLVRNLLATSQAPLTKTTANSKLAAPTAPSVREQDVGVLAVVAAFDANRVFQLLLTLALGLGSDFDKAIYAGPVLECVYLLTKDVEPALLTAPEVANREAPLTAAAAGALDLQRLLATEKAMKQRQQRQLLLRHGRFGTMLLVRTATASYVVLGQRALRDTRATLAQLDTAKRWKRALAFRYDSDEYTGDPRPVGAAAAAPLRQFVAGLLTSGGFNTVVEAVAGMALGDDVDEHERAALFCVLAWFFGFQRQQARASGGDFGAVGAGLSEVVFVLLVGFFRELFEGKRWSAVHAAMACFNQLLGLATELFNRPQLLDAAEVDRELAEGIVRKLFAQLEFLGLLVALPKTAAKHLPRYLALAIALVHGLLKGFEAFANEDITVYVRHKRKRRALPRATELDRDAENAVRDLIDGDSDGELDERAAELTRERQLDYEHTERRFFHPAVVTAHVEFLLRFRDLQPHEIKWCLTYFHRVFVRRKDWLALFRLDLMHVLHLLRGWAAPRLLVRAHVDEFIVYYMKKFKPAFAREPVAVELLFPRFEDDETAAFLSLGTVLRRPDKGTRPPKLAPELEFTRQWLLLEQVQCVVDVLKGQQRRAVVEDVAKQLLEMAPEVAVEPASRPCLRMAAKHHRLFISNGYLRVLVGLCGFEPPLLLEDRCQMRRLVTAAHLEECAGYVIEWLDRPSQVDPDRELSLFLRVRESDYDGYVGDVDSMGNEVGVMGDDGMGKGVMGNEVDGEFDTYDGLGPLGPLAYSQDARDLDELDRLELGIRGVARRKPKARKRAREVDAPRRRRRVAPLLSDDDAPVKLAEFIRDSDDDSDDEFYRREEQLRQMLALAGGIVSADQLAAFQKAWAAIGTRGEATADAVAQGMEKVVELAEAAGAADEVKDGELLEDVAEILEDMEDHDVAAEIVADVEAEVEGDRHRTNGLDDKRRPASPGSLPTTSPSPPMSITHSQTPEFGDSSDESDHTATQPTKRRRVVVASDDE